MARIPTYISDTTVNGQPALAPAPLAEAAAFGGTVGAATQQLGGAMIGAGVAAGNLGQELEYKQNNLDTANAVAKYDFTAEFNKLKLAAPSDPQGFEVTVANNFDKSVDDYVNGLQVNETVRTNVKTKLTSQRLHYTSAASDFATRTLETRDKIDANQGITTQVNRVRVDGSIATYNDALSKINDVIDAQPGIQAVVKEGMKKKAGEDLARRRFEGMIADTKDDPDALEGVKKDLQSEYWQSRMAPADYDAMLDQIEKRTRAANSAEAAAGRAAITNLKSRDHGGEIIDDSELAGARAAVNKSGRPELMSQMAMIERRQQVFRLGKELPLAEQYAARDKALKKGGIDRLPEPIKQGIAEGVRITNGQVSAEYLAGIVNAEYGAAADGNYGRQTGIKGPDGKPTSDATGVTQFISSTWLSTIRGNAELLGVDVAGKSDAEVLAMRADPVLSIKAAALYALANRRELQNVSGRELTDGDLYMSHFLGTKGGARFLEIADANPKGLAKDSVLPDQVAANRDIFYDKQTGKPRTNEQVRALMTQKLMNGPSRVDYGEAQAWNTVIQSTTKGLKDSPMDFAATVGKWGDLGNISTPEGMQRRAVVAQQIAEFYKIPTDDFKPFNKEEVETLAKKAQDGTADETLAVMRQVAGLGPMSKAGFKQIGEKDTLFGYAAGLAYVGGDANVAADVVRGEKRMKNDKDVKAAFGQSDSDMILSFQKVVGKAFAGTEMGTTIRKAAEAYYAEKFLSRGGAVVGRFNSDYFEQSIHAVLGGNASPDRLAIGKFNGEQTKLPQGVTLDTFKGAIRNMGAEDFAASSKWGGPPRYTDGTMARPLDIYNEGRFEWIGGKEYRIRMADNSYLLSGVDKTPDGQVRGVPYIFIGDPLQIQSIAKRTAGALPELPHAPFVMQP